MRAQKIRNTQFQAISWNDLHGNANACAIFNVNQPLFWLEFTGDHFKNSTFSSAILAHDRDFAVFSNTKTRFIKNHFFLAVFVGNVIKSDCDRHSCRVKITDA